MPTWNTGPKVNEGEKGKEVNEKNKTSTSRSSRSIKSTNAKVSTSTRKSESTKSKKSNVDEGRKEIPSTVVKEKERESTQRRTGHFGILDAITPRPPPPPPPPAPSTASIKGSSSNSRKPRSTQVSSHTSGGLSSTKSAPSAAVNKKRGSRKSNSVKKKEEPKEHVQEEGEWDESGIVWKPYPKHEVPKEPEAMEEEIRVDVHRENEVDVVYNVNQVTPTSKGKGKEPITSSPSPPPTKLRTPALGYTPFNPQIGDNTPLSLPPPQSRLLHRTHKDPNFLLNKSAREDINRQVGYHTLAEAIHKEPLFLPSLSPDTEDLNQHEEETEEEVERVESPLQRPITRRSSARIPSLRLSPGDDDEGSQRRGIPPPSWLAREQELQREKVRKERRDREKANRAEDELVPDSDEDFPPPPPHFGIEITPFVNNSPSQSSKRKSKSSSRKTKTYGKGRSHAYQHGYPLPHANSQSVALTPLPIPAKSSYKGAKRKGSTSVWRDPSVSSSDQDAIDGFDLGHDMGYNPDEQLPNTRKRKRFIRNGPPPEERLLGLFGEDEDEPHRYRRKRGKTPKHKFTSFCPWPKDNQEEKNDEAYDPDSERRRRKRRKKAIEIRHKFRGKEQPKLRLTRNKSCQARIEDYVQKVGHSTTLPRKTFLDDKPIRRKPHRYFQGTSGYGTKPIPTISYSDYVNQYQQTGDRDSNSTSRPSRKEPGGRINELIAAGRKSRFEKAIRKQRPITREITPRLPLKPLKPTQNDPQNSDEIDVELSKPSRKRGSSLGYPLYSKKPPRLVFTKNDPPSQTNDTTNNNTSSIQTFEPRNATSILGQLIQHPPSRPNKRKAMPEAFRQSALPLNDSPDILLSEDTPETSRRNENQIENEDPIVQYTQGSPPLPTRRRNESSVGYTGEPILQFSQFGVTQSTPQIPSERPSEFIRRLDRLVQQDLTNSPTLFQGEDIASELLEHAQDVSSGNHDNNDEPFDQNENDPSRNVDDVLAMFGSQIDWDAAGQMIPASQWDKLDDVFAREEADRDSKRNSKSRDGSQKENAKNNSMHLPQTVDPNPGLNKPPLMEKAINTNVKSNAATSSKLPQAQHPHPVRPDPTRRMTGMEVTQHLLQRPILPSIAQNINKTFIATSTRGTSEDQKSVPSSRKARREERDKRVKEKRAKEKRREQQTRLNFTPRASTSKNALPKIAPADEEEEEEEEVEEVEHRPPRPALGRKLTISESYRNIHPPPSNEPLRARTAAPSRFSLSNQPVVKHYKEAKHPSAKALEERNARASREAVRQVFRPPIGRLESSSDVIGEDTTNTILEPTQISTQGQVPPAGQGSNYRSLSRANSKRDHGNSRPYIKAWRSEVRPSSNQENQPENSPLVAISSKTGNRSMVKDKNNRKENVENTSWASYRSNERNQGGNPFENDLTFFQNASQSVETASLVKPINTPRREDVYRSKNKENVGETRKGKRHISISNWADSQDD